MRQAIHTPRGGMIIMARRHTIIHPRHTINTPAARSMRSARQQSIINRPRNRSRPICYRRECGLGHFLQHRLLGVVVRVGLDPRSLERRLVQFAAPRGQFEQANSSRSLIKIDVALPLVPAAESLLVVEQAALARLFPHRRLLFQALLAHLVTKIDVALALVLAAELLLVLERTAVGRSFPHRRLLCQALLAQTRRRPRACVSAQTASP